MKTALPLVAACVLSSIIFGAGSAWVTTQVISYNSTGSGSTLQSVVTNTVTETSLRSDVVDVVKMANPSVVSIVVTRELVRYKTNPRDYMLQDPFLEEFFGGSFRQPSVRTPELETQKQQIAGGTGFIVTADGKIITNKHVVQDAKAEYTAIMSDGSEFPVTVLSRDPSNDLAVLQLQPKDGQSLQNIQPLQLADAQSIEVGQIVVAIGNALGEFDNTVTMGVISAKGRSITASDGSMNGSSLEQLSNLLQTDAAINPGNSGGPLLSLSGTVIGVSTAIAQGSNGIGFAIPVDEVDFILRSVSKYGKIVRPFLGVVYRTNTPEIAKQFHLSVDYGAIIEDGVQTGERGIVADGPADKAGLRAGDVILSINGDRITKDNDLKDAIKKFLPEDEVSLSVLRGEETLVIKLQLGKREDTTVTQAGNAQADADAKAYLGVYSTNITEALQRQLRLPVKEGALLYNDFASGIPAVVKDSPADKSGLQAGDIIVSLGGEKITASRPLGDILASKKSGETVEMTILRSGKEQKMTVTLSTLPQDGEQQ